MGPSSLVVVDLVVTADGTALTVREIGRSVGRNGMIAVLGDRGLIQKRNWFQQSKDFSTLFNRMWVLPLLFGLASAARFGSYFDAECTIPIVNAIAFTDVCTWSSNRYSGSYALTLESCSDTSFSVNAYNLTGSAGCEGESVGNLTVNASCMFVGDHYVKGLDFNCESQNTTYNVLAHFTPGCEDGGYAFSMQLGEPTCLEDSFGPGLWDWDAQGNYSDPYYMLQIYNTSDGTCQDEVATFQTKEFPAWCLPTLQPFQNISIDIYPAIPVNP